MMRNKKWAALSAPPDYPERSLLMPTSKQLYRNSEAKVNAAPKPHTARCLNCGGSVIIEHVELFRAGILCNSEGCHLCPRLCCANPRINMEAAA
jgi:hypothetical protein